MGNTLLPNNPTLDEIKNLIRRINSKIKIINASVNQEELTIDSPIATIIQSNSTDPGEYTTTDIDPTNFYTKNEINTLLQGKVNSTDLDTTPTASSMNPVTSDGVKTAVDEKVSKSGDTMTGSLNITSGNINIGTAPNSNYLGISIGSTTGNYGAIRQTGARLTFDQYKNGSVGGERYQFPTPEIRSEDAWYSILTDKTPVTPAQGGTGGPDSGEVQCTLAEGVTGDLLVRSFGKIVQFGMKVKYTSALSANQSITIGTIPSGYRPKWNLSIPAGSRNRWGVVDINASGSVIYYHPNVAGDISNSFYAYTFYLIA